MMKEFLLFFLLFMGCSHQEKKQSSTVNNFVPNTAILIKHSAEAEIKLEKWEVPSILSFPNKFKVETQYCEFIKIQHILFNPPQKGEFGRVFLKTLDPNVIMGLYENSERGKNICSQIKIFHSMKEISFQKSKKNNPHYFVKVHLGVLQNGYGYIKLEYFLQNIPGKLERVFFPGFFMSHKPIKEYSDEDFAQWIINELYEVGWK